MKTKFKLHNLTTYAVPVISLIVVIILIPVVIMPQLNSIAASSKILNQNKGRLDQLESKASKLADLSTQKNDIQNNLKFVETVLPINKEVASLVLGIQELARNSGLAVSTFKIQPGKTATASATTANSTSPQTQTTAATPKSTKDNLVFNLGLAGDMKSLRTFLAALETGKRILTLSQVKSTNTVGSTYNFDLFLNAPFGSLPQLTSDQVSSPLAELTTENKKLLDDLKTPIFSDITGVQVAPGPTGPTNPFVGN